MAHIQLGNNLPGIIGLMAFSPLAAQALGQLAETLLNGPSTLSKGEREMIAAHVSYNNDCTFCHSSHAAAALAHLNEGVDYLDAIRNPFGNDKVSAKMQGLLKIAYCVSITGKAVGSEEVEEARAAGATDQEIHDTVLIAAAFCMYNRYVDGMGTEYPTDFSEYLEMGKMLATNGYVQKPEAYIQVEGLEEVGV